MRWKAGLLAATAVAAAVVWRGPLRRRLVRWSGTEVGEIAG